VDFLAGDVPTGTVTVEGTPGGLSELLTIRAKVFTTVFDDRRFNPARFSRHRSQSGFLVKSELLLQMPLDAGGQPFALNSLIRKALV